MSGGECTCPWQWVSSGGGCQCPTPVPSEADPGADEWEAEALATALSGCISNVSDLPDWMRAPALGRDTRPILLLVARAVLASDWLASHDAATADRVRRETAEAQRCGGCKGQGSHRRHCPRHPNYHPWIPLADRAESIGDSIGEPALANQAWALAGAIRADMPNHPYRPVRPRDEADS